MNALRVIALLLVLAGCTNATEGGPQAGSQPTTARSEGDVVLGNPRKIGDKLDCPALVPESMVSEAIGEQAVADTAGQIPTSCDFKLPPPPGSSVDGRVHVMLAGNPSGSKTDNFEGNSAYQASLDEGDCNFYVAVGRDKWIRIRLVLVGPDARDACVKSKALAKKVLDKLPKS